MCWEAQAVLWLRGVRIAQCGAKAEAETTRMITEKVAALAEAQVAAMTAVLKGNKKHHVAKKALGVYAKRVGRNRRRLSKYIHIVIRGVTGWARPIALSSLLPLSCAKTR